MVPLSAASCSLEPPKATLLESVTVPAEGTARLAMFKRAPVSYTTTAVSLATSSAGFRPAPSVRVVQGLLSAFGQLATTMVLVLAPGASRCS